MDRASDVFRELSEQPSLGDDERLGGTLPQLKLKPELTADVSDPASVANGLKALTEGSARNVLVHSGTDGTQAVLVPVERYVELVGGELRSSRLMDATSGGRLVPSGLADSDIEMVDPTATWPTG